MIWWYWLMLGLGLLGLEAAMPRAFVALFPGLAAIGVALLLALGPELPGPGQWLAFAILSLGSLLFLRRPLKTRARRGEGPPDAAPGG